MSASAAWGSIASRRTARSRRRPTRPTAACISINDDSRLRLADDLDITDDGRIFFSEATMRYEMHEWAIDGLESARQRPHHLLRPQDRQDAHRAARPDVPQRHLHRQRRPVDPLRRDLGLPRQALLVRRAESRARSKCVIENLPGYPDNINRASDGNYWMALVGMRTPGARSGLEMPGFRQRMAKRVPRDEWLFPNINTGCVLKFNEQGEIARDAVGSRRHQPSDDHLDARAQRLSLPRRHHEQPHRPLQDSTAPIPTSSSTTDAGGGGRDRALRDLADQFLAAARRRSRCPSFDGALKPNQLLERRRDVRRARRRRTISRPTATVALRRRRSMRPALRRRRRRPTVAQRFDRPDHCACRACRRRPRGRARRHAKSRVVGGAARRPALRRRRPASR